MKYLVSKYTNFQLSWVISLFLLHSTRISWSHRGLKNVQSLSPPTTHLFCQHMKVFTQVQLCLGFSEIWTQSKYIYYIYISIYFNYISLYLRHSFVSYINVMGKTNFYYHRFHCFKC